MRSIETHRMNDMNTTPFQIKQAAWEAAWATYISKLERLEELKAAGRYGYQLRMPKQAVQNAYAALQAFA